MNTLPPVLQRDYGGGTKFTLGQVRAACKKQAVSEKYMPYAVVIFAVVPPDIELFESVFLGVSYADTKKYLAEKFFDGNMNFEFDKLAFSKTGNSGQDPMSGGTQPD